MPTPTVTPEGPTPTPAFIRPTPTPGPSFATYKVKKGDTISSIAKKFKTSVQSIAYWNRVTYPSLDPESAKYRPDRLEVGWVLQRAAEPAGRSGDPADAVAGADADAALVPVRRGPERDAGGLAAGVRIAVAVNGTPGR